MPIGTSDGKHYKNEFDMMVDQVADRSRDAIEMTRPRTGGAGNDNVLLQDPKGKERVFLAEQYNSWIEAGQTPEAARGSVVEGIRRTAKATTGEDLTDEQIEEQLRQQPMS